MWPIEHKSARPLVNNNNRKGPREEKATTIAHTRCEWYTVCVCVCLFARANEIPVEAARTI